LATRKLLQIVGSLTLPVLIAALALFAGVLTNFDSARAAVATTQVEAFVQQNVDKGYNLLKKKSLSDAERHAQFHTFMLSISDMRRIGIFALGQYANRLSKVDTDVYIAAFTDYAIPLYESWLSKYNERTIKITGTVQRAVDDFVVGADAVSANDQAAQPFKVSFRIRKAADGSFILTDMTAEGISLALTLRSDFVAFLQQHGDRISDLVARLKGQSETTNSRGAALSSGR
jgi:phospholipid transport system substrate-binding protein